MSSQTGIESQLLEFLRHGVFSAKTDLTEETDLIGNGFDSLSLVSILLFIEKTYGFGIPEREINEETFKSIRSLATVVLRLIDERRASA